MSSFIDKVNYLWDARNTLVCVGLDPDLKKIPKILLKSKYPIFEFNKAIIDATSDLVCAYKPQVAFYAGQDAENELKMTIDYIHTNFPEIPVIFDAKRGDIGSTAQLYVKEAFDRFQADAVTLNPYMGTDTLKPFLDRIDQGSIILCRTSNSSGDELQNLISEGRPLYQIVAEYAKTKWNYNRNVMLVIGATYPDELAAVRKICPDIPFLVPGIGAQGGDIQETVLSGQNKNGGGLVINSSRSIIYASSEADFADAARASTTALRNAINQYRIKS